MTNFKKLRVRSEKHKKFIASLSCASCGLDNHSQAAHIGRGGMSLKIGDDFTLPLCCQRYGVNGCHADSEKREKVYFEKFGGIDNAIALANALYENTGNREECLRLIKDFRIISFS